MTDFKNKIKSDWYNSTRDKLIEIGKKKREIGYEI